MEFFITSLSISSCSKARACLPLPDPITHLKRPPVGLHHDPTSEVFFAVREGGKEEHQALILEAEGMKAAS